MGELAFGQSFDMLKTGEKHEAIKLLHEGQRPLGIFGSMPWLMMIMMRIPGAGAGYHRWLAYCEEFAQKRKAVCFFLVLANQLFDLECAMHSRTRLVLTLE